MDTFNELFSGFGQAVIKLLPQSPFQEAIAAWVPPQFLGWLNWFIPVGRCIELTTVWLVAIGIFYAYSVILRWVKVVGD